MAEPLSLMGVYAHPDDEQGISGSIAKYGSKGANTTLICATRGEAGEIAPDTNATPENLGEVREKEMRCAAEVIGVSQLYFLDYRDSGMAGTPENEHLDCLYQAPLLEVAERVTHIVRRERPQVMLTFDAYGGYGHPDHIQMHKAALIAFFVAGDPRGFPHQLTEDGISVWKPQKLYFGAFSRARFQAYYELMRQEGTELDEFARAFEKRAIPEEAITTRIDVGEFVDLKMKSLLCHSTQLGPNTFFAKLPREAWREGAKHETFILAESCTGRPEGVETDLFAGFGVGV